MRIYFNNIARPKKVAKNLSKSLSIKLSLAQSGIAKACGYRDWYDLEKNGISNDYIIDADLVSLYSNIIVSLFQKIGAYGNCGDIQNSVTDSHLIGSHKPNFEDQLQIRAKCFEQIDIKPQGRRKFGEIGKLKNVISLYKSKKVILIEYGDMIKVITDMDIAPDIVKESYVSPKTKIDLFIPMRLYMPYGYYVEPDGAKVLYSRDYHPMWRIREGKKPERIEPWLWIKNDPSKQVHFFTEVNAPWDNKETKEKLFKILQSYGINSLPILVEALQLLVKNIDEVGFADSARLLEQFYKK
jgi:hypothetical protein